ncbi:MAG: helix-turn-helix domain-containing protein [Candidatus Aenigmatarchaeota archaeon]
MKILKDCVKKILNENDFDYFECTGCLDIIAKKNYILLLKILYNVDSFQFEQANNLKILSKNLNALAFLLGIRTRKEKLKNNIIYERFEIPTITPNTLENILTHHIPFVHRFRGGLFVKIDPEKLRKNREMANLTQAQLARMVGVTKKSIYEHESRVMSASYEIVEKIENIIGSVSRPYDLFIKYENVKNLPKNIFEKKVSDNLEKMGFKTDLIHQTPFNIIADEIDNNFMIFLNAEKSQKRIEITLPYLKGFMKISKKYALIITDKEYNLDVPVISENELRYMDTKDIKNIVKNW